MFDNIELIRDSGKYTWSFDDSPKSFNNADFETIEECIEDAKHDLRYKYNKYPTDFIYVGEIIPYTTQELLGCIGEDIIEKAYNNAYDLNDGAESWLDDVSSYEVQILEEKVYCAFAFWLRETGNLPYFFKIINIRKVSLNDV